MGARCCTDRNKKEAQVDQQPLRETMPDVYPEELMHESIHEPVYQADPFMEERAQTKDDEAISVAYELHQSVGEGGIIIGIIGEETVKADETKVRLRALGTTLARSLGKQACFVTCGFGEDGAQAIFTEAASQEEPSAVHVLKPRSQQTGGASPAQQVIIAGNDVDHMHQIYLQICEIYITVEGGDLVTEAAMAAAYWGSLVIPLMCTGGSSSGENLFPAGCLEPPGCVPEADWQILKQMDVTPSDLAEGMVRILEMLFAARKQAMEAHERSKKYFGDAQQIAPVKRATEKTSAARSAVDDKEAAAMEELDFQAVMANWKPTSARGGGAVRGLVGDAGDVISTLDHGQKANEAPQGPPPVVKRDVAPMKILPLPPPTLDAANDHEDHLDDIEQAHQRMQARLEEVHQKTSKASTMLQKVFRGQKVRKALLQLKEDAQKGGVQPAPATSPSVDEPPKQGRNSRRSSRKSSAGGASG